jgi:hypothetical protein
MELSGQLQILRKVALALTAEVDGCAIDML